MEWLFIFVLEDKAVTINTVSEDVCISLLKKSSVTSFPKCINTKSGKYITICVWENNTRYDPRYKICEVQEKEFK